MHSSKKSAVLPGSTGEIYPSPLHPREFFAQAWAGEGEWVPGWWAGLVRQPRRLRFRSWTTSVAETTWLVHDETVWADGTTERRDGIAVVVSERCLRLTYDDMPGGTEVSLREDGFSFTPYRLAVRAPILPILVLVACRDDCVLLPDGTLQDTVEVRFLGVRLGRQIVRLRRAER